MLRSTDDDAGAIERIEELAGDRAQLIVGHHLDDGGDYLARQALAVGADPSHSIRGEQNRLQPCNGERIEFRVEATLPRTVENRTYGVIDEDFTSHVADRRSAQRAPCVGSGAIVGRTADEQIAFLECVGEREELPYTATAPQT